MKEQTMEERFEDFLLDGNKIENCRTNRICVEDVLSFIYSELKSQQEMLVGEIGKYCQEREDIEPDFDKNQARIGLRNEIIEIIKKS